MLLTLLVCLGLIAGTSLAQDDDPPPIIVFNQGDLWMWNGEGSMQQMTFWGYNQQPVLSPDGSHIAYMAWAQITVDAIQREGGVAGGEVPGDIKIMDIYTRQETVVAAQPPDAAFSTPDVPDKAVIRSKPVWSPDGSRLAWSEYDYPGEGVNRLMVYNLPDGETHTLITSLPLQADVLEPMEVAWGESGLVLESVTAMDDANIVATTFLVYNSDGADQLLTTIPVQEDANRFLLGFVLVMYQDKEYIGAGYSSGEWDLFDPITGKSQPAPGVPEMYSPSAPEDSLSFALVASGTHGIRYQLLDADGQPIGEPFDMDFDAPSHMALSPDGQSVAYIPYDSEKSGYKSWVTLVNQGGEVNRIEVNPYGFAFMWGPIAWRIRS